MPVLGFCQILLSLVISFIYLTNQLTNIRAKLYTFCILSVQSQHNNIKKDSPLSVVLTLLCCSKVIVLLCTAEAEREHWVGLILSLFKV